MTLRTFPRPELRLQPELGIGPVFICVFIATAVLFNISISGKLWLTHIAEVGLLLIGMVICLLRAPTHRVRWATIWLWSIVLGYFGVAVILSLNAPYFVEESLKILLIVVTFVALMTLDPHAEWLNLYLAVFVLALVVICLVTGFHFGFTLPSGRQRFFIASLGSYNTLGFLLGAAVFFAVYLHDDVRRRYRRWVWTTVICALVIFLLLTLSRGGILTVTAAIAGYLLRRRGHRIALAMVLVGGAAATVYALRAFSSEDVLAAVTGRFDLGGDPTVSGRTVLWASLLSTLIDQPQNLLFGFGIGSIDLTIASSYFRSAHNTYLEVTYYFGLIGLAILLVLLRRATRGSWRLGAVDGGLRFAVGVMVLVSMIVDSYWGTSQILWFSSFLFYILFSRPVLSNWPEPVIARADVRKTTVV